MVNTHNLQGLCMPTSFDSAIRLYDYFKTCSSPYLHHEACVDTTRPHHKFILGVYNNTVYDEDFLSFIEEVRDDMDWIARDGLSHLMASKHHMHDTCVTWYSDILGFSGECVFLHQHVRALKEQMPSEEEVQHETT